METREKKSIIKMIKKTVINPEEIAEKLQEGLKAVKDAISEVKGAESKAKIKFQTNVFPSSRDSDFEDPGESGIQDETSLYGQPEFVEEEEDEITISGIGPKVTSADPNERKMARRLRIQKRMNIVKRQKKEGALEDTEEQGPKTMVEQQILNSIVSLDKMIAEGNEQVTNVRVATDAREVKRRYEQEEAKQMRMQMIEEEEVESVEKLEEIFEIWRRLAKSNDPLDIYDEMEKQKERCDELIKRKDEIIEKLTDELERSHEQFTRDQKKQKEDVNILSDRIDGHIKMMQNAYKQELLLLEEAIKMEQNELLDECNTEWNDLYDEREKQEVENMKKKFELILDYEKEMESIHVEHHEKFRDAKVRLEGDIHVLQQELEKVKALCLLNSEKLDYNFQILKKRDDENLLMKAHQKRRINKLQDIVNRLRAQIDEIEQTVNIEKQKLNDQISKLHSNIIDIGRKADHFAEVNDRKYHQIWEMNEQLAHELLEKILTADRIIHEQHLGLEWEPPLLSALSKNDLPSYSTAMTAVDDLFRQKSYKEISDSSLSGLDDIHTIKMKGDLLRHILERIADKSGFLVEEKIFGLLYPFRKTEKTLVKIENIFMALGIQTTEDVEMLKKYFIPYLSCEVCGYSPSTQVSKETVVDAKDKEEENMRDEQRIDDDSIISIKSSESSCQGDEIDVLSSLQRGAKCSQEFNILDDKKFGKKNKCERGEMGEKPDREVEIREESDTSILGANLKEKYVEVSIVPDSDGSTKTTKDLITQCHPSHPLKIDPIYVLKALRGFVADFSKNKEIVCESMSDRLAKNRKTVSRALKTQDVRAYWERFTLIFTAEKEKLWDSLLIGLHKYHEILQERHNLNIEVQSLHQQNEELKRLLQQYMQSFGGCGRRILPPLKPLPRCNPQPRCCIRKC